MKTIKTILLVVLASLSQSALAWREAGHFTVCEIAYRHLTGHAKTQVDTILGGKDFASQCTWPDMIRKSPEFKHTYDWHFINLEDNQRYFEPETVNPKCDVMRSVVQAQATLRDSGIAPANKLHALRFLGHYVGDMHQPLHVGRKSDLGGNNVKVNWYGSPTYTSVEILRSEPAADGQCAGDGRYLDEATGECVKRNTSQEQATLHKTWDLLMVNKFIEQQGLTAEPGDSQYLHKALATAVDRNVQTEDALRWQRSTPAEWAQESQAYRLQPYDTIGSDLAVVYPLGGAYYDGHINDLTGRMLKAGYRLAGTLNRAFDQTADSPLQLAFVGLRGTELEERLQALLTSAGLALPGTRLTDRIACPRP